MARGHGNDDVDDGRERELQPTGDDWVEHGWGAGSLTITAELVSLAATSSMNSNDEVKMSIFSSREVTSTTYGIDKKSSGLWSTLIQTL